MVLNQARPKRKASGARYKKQTIRRQHETGREPALTKIESTRKKTVRTLGGNKKTKALATRTAHLITKDGKHVNATITSVKDNPANRHFIRRNIITKGAIIETDKGDARVTSRPGQHGTVQGVLI